MLRHAAQKLLSQGGLASSLLLEGSSINSQQALRGYALRALQAEDGGLLGRLVEGTGTSGVGTKSSVHVSGHITTPLSPSSASAVELEAPAQLPGQLTSSRRMGFAYARTPHAKPYVYRKHEAEFGFGQLTEYLVKVVPKFIKFAVTGPAATSQLYQEPTIYVDPEHIVPLMYFLRDHVNTQFKSVMDITAVDFPERPARFEVVYHLLSPRWNNRIRVKVAVDELTPVPSITRVYNGANWFEREVWDMFGVYFSDHPDLRRILTDYGFTGHPLRKDFPLTGYTEVRYDWGKKRVVYEPLELSQEFRYFDFTSPWEQLQR